MVEERHTFDALPILGRYIGKMKLKGYRGMGFKDSLYNPKVKKYTPNIYMQLFTEDGTLVGLHEGCPLEPFHFHPFFKNENESETAPVLNVAAESKSV